MSFGGVRAKDLGWWLGRGAGNEERDARVWVRGSNSIFSGRKKRPGRDTGKEGMGASDEAGPCSVMGIRGEEGSFRLQRGILPA